MFLVVLEPLAPVGIVQIYVVAFVIDGTEYITDD
jgi:hypothetical protein